MEYVPRGPVYRAKSGTPDYTDKYNDKLTQWRSAARERAEQMQRLNIELVAVSRYLRGLTGDWWHPGRARFRSRFVTNRLAKTRYDDLAQLTDTRPTMDITTSIDTFKDIAEAVNQLIHIEWVRNRIDLTLVMAADICKAYGTSFWKIGARKPGVTVITPCGPDQVLPINPGFSIQESTGVLYRTWKSPGYLKRMFPFRADYIEHESEQSPAYGLAAGDSTYLRPAHIDTYTWNSLNPGMQRVLGVKGAAVPIEPFASMFNSVQLEEYWIDDPTDNNSQETVIVRDPYLNIDAHNWWYEVGPGMPLYPRKRLITFVGRRHVYDGPSPFWHGLYPFPALRLNPVFFSFWGLSKYRDLMPINMAMNEIAAGCLDIIKRILSPTAVTAENAVHSAAWKEFFPDMPGMKLKVAAGQDPTKAIRYMENPEISAVVVTLLMQFFGPEFDRIAGNIDVQQLMKKAQVPGGDTIDQMRDAMATGLRMEGRQVEGFLEDAGAQAVSNILQFYTPAQMLKLIGEAGLTQSTFVGSRHTIIPGEPKEHPDFWKNFALNIAPGSLHAGAHDRKKVLSITLGQSGIISKRQVMRDAGYSNIPQILQELAEENAPHPDNPEEPMLPEASGRNARLTRGQRNGSPV